MTSMRPADPLRQDLNEVRPAVEDVVFELTHDLSDTPEDLRDAAAFAPIALVKALGGVADYLAARPRRTLAIAGTMLLAIGLFLAARRRSQNKR